MAKDLNDEVYNSKGLVKNEVYYSYSGVYSRPFKCRSCHSELTQSETYIPIDGMRCVKVIGMRCTMCGAMHIEDSFRVRTLLNNAPDSWVYKLDEKSKNAEYKLNDVTQSSIWANPKQSTKYPPASSIMWVKIKMIDRETRKIAFIVNDINDANRKRCVYHYSDIEAREILSALLYHERNGIGTLGKHQFTIHSYYYYQVGQQTISLLCPKQLYIRSGGGTYTSVLKRQGEIVDMLVYSYCTQRFEILRATYDINTDGAYVDVRLFRDYVDTFGRPALKYAVVRDYKSSSTDFLENLNSESILKIYGYEVRDGVSEGWRQKLLAELIDLQILYPHDILKFLEFFIAMHSDVRFINARIEWEKDWRFVLNYKANPSRLMTAR